MSKTKLAANLKLHIWEQNNNKIINPYKHLHGAFGGYLPNLINEGN